MIKHLRGPNGPHQFPEGGPVENEEKRPIVWIRGEEDDEEEVIQTIVGLQNNISITNFT